MFQYGHLLPMDVVNVIIYEYLSHPNADIIRDKKMKIDCFRAINGYESEKNYRDGMNQYYQNLPFAFGMNIDHKSTIFLNDSMRSRRLVMLLQDIRKSKSYLYTSPKVMRHYRQELKNECDKNNIHYEHQSRSKTLIKKLMAI